MHCYHRYLLLALERDKFTRLLRSSFHILRAQVSSEYGLRRFRDPTLEVQKYDNIMPLVDLG
jgi:hypothetical protein